MRSVLKFLAVALALLVLAGLCGCKKDTAPVKTDDTPGKTDGGREDEIIRLARTFRIYGAYDSGELFELRRQYDFMIYCLFTCELGESGVKGYGSVSAEDADARFAEVIGKYDVGGLKRTAYEPSQIQVIYYANGYYYVMLTDDSAMSYELVSFVPAKEGEGAFVAEVKIKGPEGEFCMALDLAENENGGFTVKKCRFEEYA